MLIATTTATIARAAAYRAFRGQVLSGDDLLAIVSGLRENALLGLYSHVLTGYIGSASCLRAIAATVAEVQEKNPAAIYVCDPVLGDAG